MHDESTLKPLLWSIYVKPSVLGMNNDINIRKMIFGSLNKVNYIQPAIQQGIFSVKLRRSYVIHFLNWKQKEQVFNYLIHLFLIIFYFT